METEDGGGAAPHPAMPPAAAPLLLPWNEASPPAGAPPAAPFPQDLATSATSLGETLGPAMDWVGLVEDGGSGRSDPAAGHPPTAPRPTDPAPSAAMDWASIVVNLLVRLQHLMPKDNFKKAYNRLIEPIPDKSQWPKVDLAPLGKRSVGRQRKNRIKGALEGGGGGGKKKSNDKGEVTEKEKKRIRGPSKCQRCGELGHTQRSYKCPYNGTKKRPRKPRKNSTKGWFPAEVSTPTRETNTNTSEAIIQDSPGVETCGSYGTK
ncbi:hypothetical protein ACP70R_029853 [Stipagrostis hirtigluma subsp. patula]